MAEGSSSASADSDVDVHQGRCVDVESRCSFQVYTDLDTDAPTFHHFDFSSMCSESDYVANDQLAHTYYANVCGNTKQICLPASWKTTYSTGVAIQAWGGQPSCSPPSCTDPTTGAAVCCTKNCQVLGTSDLFFELMDPGNPWSGGVRATAKGAAASDSDPFWCDFNPVTGAQYEREVHFIFQCSPLTPAPGLLQSGRQNNTNDCRYVLDFATPLACSGWGGSTLLGLLCAAFSVSFLLCAAPVLVRMRVHAGGWVLGGRDCARAAWRMLRGVPFSLFCCGNRWICRTRLKGFALPHVPRGARARTGARAHAVAALLVTGGVASALLAARGYPSVGGGLAVTTLMVVNVHVVLMAVHAYDRHLRLTVWLAAFTQPWVPYVSAVLVTPLAQTAPDANAGTPQQAGVAVAGSWVMLPDVADPYLFTLLSVQMVVLLLRLPTAIALLRHGRLHEALPPWRRGRSVAIAQCVAVAVIVCCVWVDNSFPAVYKASLLSTLALFANEVGLTFEHLLDHVEVAANASRALKATSVAADGAEEGPGVQAGADGMDPSLRVRLLLRVDSAFLPASTRPSAGAAEPVGSDPAASGPGGTPHGATTQKAPTPTAVGAPATPADLEDDAAAVAALVAAAAEASDESDAEDTDGEDAAAPKQASQLERAQERAAALMDRPFATPQALLPWLVAISALGAVSAAIVLGGDQLSAGDNRLAAALLFSSRALVRTDDTHGVAWVLWVCGATVLLASASRGLFARAVVRRSAGDMDAPGSSSGEAAALNDADDGFAAAAAAAAAAASRRAPTGTPSGAQGSQLELVQLASSHSPSPVPTARSRRLMRRMGEFATTYRLWGLAHALAVLTQVATLGAVGWHILQGGYANPTCDNMNPGAWQQQDPGVMGRHGSAFVMMWTKAYTGRAFAGAVAIASILVIVVSSATLAAVVCRRRMHGRCTWMPRDKSFRVVVVAKAFLVTFKVLLLCFTLPSAYFDVIVTFTLVSMAVLFLVKVVLVRSTWQQAHVLSRGAITEVVARGRSGSGEAATTAERGADADAGGGSRDSVDADDGLAAPPAPDRALSVLSEAASVIHHGAERTRARLRVGRAFVLLYVWAFVWCKVAVFVLIFASAKPISEAQTGLSLQPGEEAWGTACSCALCFANPEYKRVTTTNRTAGNHTAWKNITYGWQLPSPHSFPGPVDLQCQQCQPKYKCDFTDSQVGTQRMLAGLQSWNMTDSGIRSYLTSTCGNLKSASSCVAAVPFAVDSVLLLCILLVSFEVTTNEMSRYIQAARKTAGLPVLHMVDGSSSSYSFLVGRATIGGLVVLAAVNSYTRGSVLSASGGSEASVDAYQTCFPGMFAAHRALIVTAGLWVLLSARAMRL